MYIIIHELDLYINIAFHPENDQNTHWIKRKTDFKGFQKSENKLVLRRRLKNLWMNCKIQNYYKSIKIFRDAVKQILTPELFINAIKYFGWNAFLAYLSLLAHTHTHTHCASMMSVQKNNTNFECAYKSRQHAIERQMVRPTAGVNRAVINVHLLHFFPLNIKSFPIAPTSFFLLSYKTMGCNGRLLE